MSELPHPGPRPVHTNEPEPALAVRTPRSSSTAASASPAKVPAAPRRILVLGATSGIAEACCRLWAARGDHLFLIARNAEKLAAVAADLHTRGAASVGTAVADLDDTTTHPELLAHAIQALCDPALPGPALGTSALATSAPATSGMAGSTPGTSTPGASGTSGSNPGISTPGTSTPGASGTSGSNPGISTPGTSTPATSGMAGSTTATSTTATSTPATSGMSDSTPGTSTPATSGMAGSAPGASGIPASTTAVAAAATLDIALLALGVLGDQPTAQADFPATAAILHTNFTAPVSLLTWLGNYCGQRHAGTLAVLSSVAGERGRQSNYIYGSAKAGLTAFTSGLRNRLDREGVRVLTIKPGPVRTAMTDGMKGSARFADPDAVAAAIVRALDRLAVPATGDQPATGSAAPTPSGPDVLYVPAPWRLIMFVIRAIPERLFKRLKL